MNIFKSKKKILFITAFIVIVLMILKITSTKHNLYCIENACIKVSYNKQGKIIKTNAYINNVMTDERIFDENGRTLSERNCKGSSFGKCNASYGKETRYDEKGNEIMDGYCSKYGLKDCEHFNTETIRKNDTKGNKIYEKHCSDFGTEDCIYSAYKNSYDTLGRLIVQRDCARFNDKEECEIYGEGLEYSYDLRGEKISSKTCSEYDSNDKCLKYTHGIEYIHDLEGKILANIHCFIYDSNGRCLRQFRGDKFIYNNKGQKIALLRCKQVDQKLRCLSPKDGEEWEYDEKGRKILTRYCEEYDKNGICIPERITAEIYDDTTGKKIASRFCKDSTCSTYDSEFIEIYDKNDKNLGSVYYSIDIKSGQKELNSVSLYGLD